VALGAAVAVVDALGAAVVELALGAVAPDAARFGGAARANAHKLTPVAQTVAAQTTARVRRPESLRVPKPELEPRLARSRNAFVAPERAATDSAEPWNRSST
jgi:hypothetical protein